MDLVLNIGHGSSFYLLDVIGDGIKWGETETPNKTQTAKTHLQFDCIGCQTRISLVFYVHSDFQYVYDLVICP